LIWKNSSLCNSFISPAMSILINYANSPFSQASRIIDDHHKALGADALDFLLASLHEITHRLENKLIDISRLSKHVTFVDAINGADIRLARTALVDVWSFIDNVHRAAELLPVLDLKINDDGKAILYQVKLVRNSFHHLNERISEYFAENGGSVFGDISWFHRSIRSERLCQSLFQSGVIRKVDEDGIERRYVEFRETKGEANSTGVFDVECEYVIKLPKQEVKILKLSLDEIAGLMNNIITDLNIIVSNTIAQIGPGRTVDDLFGPYDGFGPLIIHGEQAPQ